MSKSIRNWEKFLKERPKDELVDIIVQRMYQDPALMRILQNRFELGNGDLNSAIELYKKQIEVEMDSRYPDTQVMRSATDSFMTQLENWSIYECCVGCVTIMRVLDEALSNGAGMEDESDFELQMDIEEASDFAVRAVKEEEISVHDKEKLLEYLGKEANINFNVFGQNIVTDILKEVEKKCLRN